MKLIDKVIEYYNLRRNSFNNDLPENLNKKDRLYIGTRITDHVLKHVNIEDVDHRIFRYTFNGIDKVTLKLNSVELEEVKIYDVDYFSKYLNVKTEEEEFNRNLLFSEKEIEAMEVINYIITEITYYSKTNGNLTVLELFEDHHRYATPRN